MSEKISYSKNLQNLIDTYHRAVDLNDDMARFNLAKWLLKTNQKAAQKEAFNIFKELASKKDYLGEAKYMLGRCYESGLGIQKSYPRAIKWYKDISFKISKDVHYRKITDDELGDILYELDNRVIPPDEIEAITELAEDNDIDAQKFLIDFYGYGDKYTKPNYKDEFYWIKRAAQNGDVESIAKLGRIYYYGNELYVKDRDVKKGRDLMLVAAKKGSAGSAYHLGLHYEKMKANKTACEWFRYYAELEILHHYEKFKTKEEDKNAI
jgi:TPR repeat protein